MIKPEPIACCGRLSLGGLCPPRFSKKSLKKSSKGEPGGNFGAPGAAGSNDIVVDILTTAGESLAESSEKSGG
tara:strand:+ start:2930 stop:3148 length:219 start_codon:yes stop_codon:yes gene_type:complete